MATLIGFPTAARCVDDAWQRFVSATQGQTCI
jgi:hypothetical protein